GMATGFGPGTVIITAQPSLSLKSGATLTVSGAAVNLSSIVVSPAASSLPVNSSQQFRATGNYTDGSSAESTSLVTLRSTPATITASIAGQSDTSTLTVVPAHLTSIDVRPSVQTIAAGTTQLFTAVGNFDDGSTQLLQSVTWSSSSTSAAQIDLNGVATGVGAGTSTITAASGSVSGTASLTVSAATLVSIAVTTTASSSMAVGTTKQYNATGTFSDSSLQDITAVAVWTSSTPATATINAQGLASSVATGTTTIGAAFGSVSGSTGLTVSTAHLVMRHVSSVVVIASLFVAAHGAAYGAPLQSYTPQTSGGTLITFEGQAEGTLISN